MFQSAVCCKGFFYFYLATFSVLTHFLIEPVIGVVSEKEEQFVNGAVYKNEFGSYTQNVPFMTNKTSFSGHFELRTKEQKF